MRIGANPSTEDTHGSAVNCRIYVAMRTNRAKLALSVQSYTKHFYRRA